MDEDLLPINSDVYIKNLRSECGKGVIDGNILNDSKRKAVRFNPTLFTKEGVHYMKRNQALNPNGKLSVIFLVPIEDLVPVGTHIKAEKQDGTGPKRKVRK
jgi:hypothetical protein